jgi:hypothetical protein
MWTVTKSRTTAVRRFFIDLVDFAIYVVRSGGATIFLQKAILSNGKEFWGQINQAMSVDTE